MPRKPRRTRLSNGATDYQLWALRYGVELLPSAAPDPIFASDHDARGSWKRNRDRLMAESPAGCRPAAFWRYDVGVDDAPRDQLAALFERRLISLDEAVLIERDHPELAGIVGPSIFGSLQALRAARYLDVDTLCMWECQHAFSAAWHAWRDRPADAEVYRRRVAMVQAVIAERAGVPA